MSRGKSLSSSAPTMDPGTPTPGRTQFSIPDLLQLYRQTLYMAVKEADLSAAGNPFGEDGLAEIRADLDNWNSIEFDPPGCLRLSKKSGACQKIVSYWKKLLGSILVDRDPSSFGNHDRGVMTICKLLHKDFQVACAAITKWNDRDFPNIPVDQAKEKLSMNQLTFLCRRYHNDLTLIAHAFKSSVTTNDFKFLNPRLSETYPIDPEYDSKEDSVSPTVSPSKVEKRKRISSKYEKGEGGRGVNGGDQFNVSMASMYGKSDTSEPKLASFSEMMQASPLPSPLSTTGDFFHLNNQSQIRKTSSSQQHDNQHNQSILKSLLPGKAGKQQREYMDQPIDLGRKKVNGGGQTNGHGPYNQSMNEQQHPAEPRQNFGMEIEKLRARNKKYVGMIMALVQQIVASGAMPFVDLRNVDPEDREDISGPAHSNNGRHQSTFSVPQNGGHVSHSSPAPNVPVPPKRKPVTHNPPNVIFDRSTMIWNGTKENGCNSQYDDSRAPEVPMVSSKRSAPSSTNTMRPTALSSLLNEPPITRQLDHSTPTMLTQGDGRSGLSSKSKRKNNPIKRELPGFAPRGTSSPEGGVCSDESGSVGSGEHPKSIKASSLFIPPVETTYVETRGSGMYKRSNGNDETLRQVSSSSSRTNGNGSNKRKCSLQSMADSLLFANGGMSSVPSPVMPDALPMTSRRSWFAEGSYVLGKLREANMLYPGQVVERRENGYLIAWINGNEISTVAKDDIYSLDEVLVPMKEVMVRWDDQVYHDCVLVNIHRGNTYTVLNSGGDGVYRRCSLADLIIPARDLSLNKPDVSHKYGFGETFEMPETVLDARTFHRKSSQQQVELNMALRNTCFLLTWQKTSVFNGYDDEQLTIMIQMSGGVVVKNFDDLIASSGDKFLAAPCACSTNKFFQCLAANIPCVSYQWVIDCCLAGIRRDYLPHVLPAGMDNDHVILWKPRHFMFDGLRVGLYSSSSKFYDVWMLALKAGGVAVSIMDPQNASIDLANVDVVIIDQNCPKSISSAALAAGVHLVNDNWLKRSLIHGKMQAWDESRYLPASD